VTSSLTWGWPAGVTGPVAQDDASADEAADSPPPRELEPRTACERCGKEFEPRGGKRFCSRNCQWRAYEQTPAGRERHSRANARYEATEKGVVSRHRREIRRRISRHLDQLAELEATPLVPPELFAQDTTDKKPGKWPRSTATR
jgi:hypothetical protein